MPNEPLLPLWYRTLQKVAGQLATGCAAAGIVLKGSKDYIPKDLFDIMLILLIPFAVICIILSGGRVIEKIKSLRFKIDNNKT